MDHWPDTMEQAGIIAGLFDSGREIDVAGTYDKDIIWFILGYSENNDISQRLEIIYRDMRDIEGISTIYMTVCRTSRYKAISIYKIGSWDISETWYRTVLSEDLQIQRTTIGDIATISSIELKKELYPRIIVISRIFHPLCIEEDRTWQTLCWLSDI